MYLRSSFSEFFREEPLSKSIITGAFGSLHCAKKKSASLSGDLLSRFSFSTPAIIAEAFIGRPCFLGARSLTRF